MRNEIESLVMRLVPAWVVTELRDKLATIILNQEKFMADTTALTAATDALTQAVTDLEARIAAIPPATNDQPAIDAAAAAVKAAADALATIDPTPKPAV